MAQRRPAGTVTVLFTDVEGSTALRNTRGDRVAQRIFDIQEDIVRREVVAHAGQVVKTLGDGFMVAFCSVIPALSAAIAIQRALAAHGRLNPHEGTRVRMGLNSGEVLRQNGDLLGVTVNAAARIADKAKGGEILISDIVRRLMPATPGLSLRTRRPVQLKGFSERWRLHEVLWEATPSAAPPCPAAAGGQFATLHAAVDRAGHGDRAPLFVALAEAESCTSRPDGGIPEVSGERRVDLLGAVSLVRLR